MVYREYLPHRLLRPFIECYWSAQADKPPFQEKEALIPDGTVELMFNYGDDYHQVDGEEEKNRVKGSHVIGIRKSALFIAQSSNQHFFCVRFKPGGTLPFFKIPAHEFAHRITRIGELLPYKYQVLEDQIYHAATVEGCIGLMDGFFLKEGFFDQHTLTLNQGFMQLAASPNHSIAGAVDQLNVNYKALERSFKEGVGLTPKEYLSIRRFNKSVQLLYSARYSSLTRLALDAGYYDQAHFNRSFKRLSGQTPSQFLKSQFKIVEVIQPALAERLSKTYNF